MEHIRFIDHSTKTGSENASGHIVGCHVQWSDGQAGERSQNVQVGPDPEKLENHWIQHISRLSFLVTVLLKLVKPAIEYYQNSNIFHKYKCSHTLH